MTSTEQAPLNTAWAEPSESKWRWLAMQFDAHRMQTLGNLKCLLIDHEVHRPIVVEFLPSRPLEAESLLLDIVRNMAKYGSIPPLTQVNESEDQEEDEEDGQAAWRRLAFQFDEHRVRALKHLESLLLDPEGYLIEAEQFLRAGPDNGVTVMHARLQAALNM